MSHVAGDSAFSPTAQANFARSTSGRLRLICLLLLLAWLGVCTFTGADRATSADPLPDFEYFYRGGYWLLHHGAVDPGYDILPDGRLAPRGTLEWYLPFVPRMMTLLAWLPPRIAGGTWFALNILATLAILRMVARHLTDEDPRNWPVTQLVPFFLLSVFWHWEFRLNQVNNLTLLLLLGSFVCWRQRRNVVAGVWLGLAVLIKVTPLLLVLWFVMKRQFRTAAVAMLTVIVAGPVADAIAFGPAVAASRYQDWFRRAVSDGSHRGLILTQTEMDWRNQGMGAVLSRWLHATDYSLHYDNDPRLAGADEPAVMNVADLPASTVASITTGVQILSLIGLLWLVRRPAAQLGAWQLRLEWALFLMAMLWFMPVMRGYHLIWLLPALSVIAAAARKIGRRRPWSKLALACAIGLIVVQFSLRWEWPQAAGMLLLTVAMVALPVLILLVRLARNPAVMSDGVETHG